MSSAWLVLCKRANRVSLVDLVTGIEKQRDTKVIEVSPDAMEIEVHDSLTGNIAGLSVGVEDEDHVREECQELADQLDDGPERDAIAACDLRYVISWDPEYGDETYNATMVAAEVIAEACKGVVYDEDDGAVRWCEAG